MTEAQGAEVILNLQLVYLTLRVLVVIGCINLGALLCLAYWKGRLG